MLDVHGRGELAFEGIDVRAANDALSRMSADIAPSISLLMF
jgi:hypothetical protein